MLSMVWVGLELGGLLSLAGLGLGGGVSGASLFFPPFPFSLIRFGPWDKTLHSTHTHTTAGIAKGAGFGGGRHGLGC